MSSLRDKAIYASCGAAAGIGAMLLWRRASLKHRAWRAASGGPRPIEQLVRPNIWRLQPYRCARDDYSSGVLLDANENGFGPPISDNPLVYERYPCPYQWELKERVAQLRGVRKEQVFVGVGSDEAIDMIIRIFCEPGQDAVLITPPTYGMYSVSAATNDVDVVKVPLEPETFQLRVSAILDAARDIFPAVKVVFACTPGNPTSRLLRPTDIIALLESDYDGIVVADEAYIDFAGEGASLAPLVAKYPRLVVLQTMSKAFGLASVRCGFAIADESIINVMNKVKAPYNVNKLTSQVARRALGAKPLEQLAKTIGTIKSERTRVAAALKAIKEVGQVHESDTNFLLFEVGGAHAVYKSMAEAGVVVRFRGTQQHCNDCLRVTIGTPSENDAFLKLLAATAARVVAEAEK